MSLSNPIRQNVGPKQYIVVYANGCIFIDAPNDSYQRREEMKRYLYPHGMAKDIRIYPRDGSSISFLCLPGLPKPPETIVTDSLDEILFFAFHLMQKTQLEMMKRIDSRPPPEKPNPKTPFYEDDNCDSF